MMMIRRLINENLDNCSKNDLLIVRFSINTDLGLIESKNFKIFISSSKLSIIINSKCFYKNHLVHFNQIHSEVEYNLIENGMNCHPYSSNNF